MREQIDLHGHKVAYSWDTSSGHALLEAATYNDYGDAVRNVVKITYEDRPDSHIRFSAGIRQTLTKRVKTIEVTHGGALVRRYELGYAPGAHSRLTTVELVGNDATSRMPALSLKYTEPSFATDGQITAMGSPPGRSPSDPNAEIADLDGDGLPDLLVTQAGQFRSYINHDGQAWKPGSDWVAADSPSVVLGTAGVQLADLDGDGAIDLVAKSGVDSFRYFPGKNATSFAAPVTIKTVPNFTFEDPDVRLADMDGDRRTDVVITTSAGLAIGYNLGGTDWTEPAIVGVVDQRQPLRFSDGGHTQLCDVNGDRVQDLCYLRSGSLVYWLGRGRGVFETAQTATGVPEWDPSSPWELHDLDGDGWADLAHIGVGQVDFALAKVAGVFDAPRSIKGTPEKLPTTIVKFADMNGSGTTDIVWIDVSRSAEQAWRYLELFPKGRGGLLERTDNGLGKVTSITYGSAALDAAAARDAGKPWTSRINVAMPVVKRMEVNASLGDPVVSVEYIYRDGTWDPSERTFAAFGGGTERQVGDAYTPTLLTENTFDTGLTCRVLRGQTLTSESRDETGYVFGRSKSVYTQKAIATALDGRTVQYAYKSSEQMDAVEGSDASRQRTTLAESEQDNYGNVTAERHWGEVVGQDKLAGKDEALTVRTFANNVDDWILGRVATEELQDASGNRVAMKRVYYDGEAFVGLPLGQVARGDVSRQEQWVGPAPDAFELDISTSYDTDGHPTETRDARGGGRIFAWDSTDHTRLLSETVKIETGNLTELADIDGAFGNLLGVVGYDGQKTSYQYDPFGRVTAAVRPGDTDDKPTVRYTYMPSAPLSRIVTESRIWAAKDEFETTEDLIDGAGRKRASLTREDGQWVLAGVSLLDARGQARRTLRPRFVGVAEHDAPPLQTDALGVDAWRDASGRAVRTRTQLGIETRTAYEPLVTKRWDGAQTDPSSPYEHTPVIETRDGLGRTVATSHALGGQILSASYGYNAAGHLVSKIDPELNTSRYAYDGRGRRTSVDDPDVGHHGFVFDATGNLTEHHKPDGVVQRFTSDLAGRALTEDWDGDGSPEVVSTWDRSDRHPDDATYLGKLVKTIDPSGSTEHEYDGRQRVTASHQTIDGATYDVLSAYDDLDRERLHTYPDGSSLAISRNLRGQVSGYGDAVKFAYAGDGLEITKTFNTGVVETTSYDDDRRRDHAEVKNRDGSVLQHLKWAYDGAGNILGVQDLRTGVDASRDRTESYTYDNLYRLRDAKGTWGTTHWNFSASGNLVERTSTVSAQHAGVMAYGAGAGPHALTSFMGRTISYDVLGRMQSDGDRAYTWNADDQLTKVTSKTGASVESTFDAGGTRRMRVERDASGAVHKTIFIDAWSEVRDGKLVRFIVHGGRRIARLADTTGRSSKSATAAGSTSDEPPQGRFSRVPLDACAYFMTLALIVALAVRCQKLLRRMAVAGVPALALLVLAACHGGDANTATGDTSSSPAGTVQVLGDDDEILLGDAIGSLTEQVSGAGTPKASFAAYPFGLTRYDTSSESRRYANSPRDNGVGLDQMGARSFAPDLGVWTSGDPLAISGPAHGIGHGFAAVNPYAYANLTPAIAADEDGHFWHIVAGAAIGAVIGGGIEAVRQYATEGKISDWGRVGSAAAGGAVAGAITAACPTVAIGTTMAVGAVSGAAGGMAERAAASGGKSVGSVGEVAMNAAVGAVTAGVVRGGTPAVSRAIGTLARGATKGVRNLRAALSPKTVSLYHGSINNGERILNEGFDPKRLKVCVSRDVAAAEDALKNHYDAIPGEGKIIEFRISQRDFVKHFAAGERPYQGFFPHEIESTEIVLKSAKQIEIMNSAPRSFVEPKGIAK